MVVSFEATQSMKSQSWCQDDHEKLLSCYHTLFLTLKKVLWFFWCGVETIGPNQPSSHNIFEVWEQGSRSDCSDRRWRVRPRFPNYLEMKRSCTSMFWDDGCVPPGTPGLTAVCAAGSVVEHTCCCLSMALWGCRCLGLGPKGGRCWFAQEGQLRSTDVRAKGLASPFVVQCVNGVKYHGTGVTKPPHWDRNSLLFGAGRGANLPFSLLVVTVILTGTPLPMEQLVIHKPVNLC